MADGVGDVRLRQARDRDDVAGTRFFDRLALEPADRGNGCLWAVPGSHRDGSSGKGGEWTPDRRFVLREADNKAKKKTLAFTAPQPQYDLSAAKPIECAAGTLVLLHGHVLHYSGENTSPVSRHSYAAHYVEGGKGLEWAPDNWLQRPEGFEPLYDDDEKEKGGGGA